MKATELMIGDIVMFKRQYYPTRIKVIDNTHCMPFEDMRIPGWVKYGGLNNIEPIPLTPEILEKNGFKIEDRGDLLYEYNQDGSLNIYISIWGKKDRYGHCKVRQVCLDGGIIYIHEIQHALRLCGLNELADNFKI